MSNNKKPIPHRVYNPSKEHPYVAGAVDIIDDRLSQNQQDVNENTYRKSETYSKEQLNNLITTPEQQYVTVTADNQTVDVTDVLPATGEADTIYRVGNWDGEQYDPTVYSEYAWEGTEYVFLCVKSQIGEVFDISEYHSGQAYDTLADALDPNSGGGVPQSLQKGGMSIKFVHTSDNKYVQYRYLGTATTGTPNPFLDVTNWQNEDIDFIADGLLEVDKTEITLIQGGFINTGTQIISLTPTSSSAWAYAIVNCSEGDAFNVCGMGQGTVAAAWTFIDANNTRLSRASQDDINEVIYAPAGASKLILNCSEESWNRKSYKINNSISEIKKLINEGYLYAGLAEPDTTPPTPTGKVFYIARVAGQYTNFNNYTIPSWGIGILYYDGNSWHREIVNNYFFTLSYTKFWIAGPKEDVDITISSTSTTIKIGSGNSVALFDWKGGYRFIAAGTYTVANNKCLYISSSNSEYQETDLSVKGTGETVYLHTENYNTAGSRNYKNWIGGVFGGCFVSPLFYKFYTDKVEGSIGADIPQLITFTQGGLILTGTQVVNPSSVTSSSAWAYAVVDCQEGDMFKINGMGQGTDASVWTFIDADNLKISQSADNDINEVIMAPKNAAKLILNNKEGYWNRKSYTGVDNIEFSKYFANSVKNRFQNYSLGWIDFTVPVNQYIPDLSDTADATNDNESSMVNVDCILKLPASYDPLGKPCKLLMVCHGSGNDISGWKNFSGYNRIVNPFIQNGYAVFDCNGYANTSAGAGFWGAPRGVECYIKAYQYICKNYNVEHDFSIYGFSMGGLTALGLASRIFPNIKCIALGSPITDLQDAWLISERHANIAAAYGFADSNVYEEDKTIGSDPTLSIISINSKETFIRSLPPVRVWFGTNDGAASITAARRFVSAVKNSNGVADIREVQGAGHEICYGDNAHCIQEYLYWIDRFN